MCLCSGLLGAPRARRGAARPLYARHRAPPCSGASLGQASAMPILLMRTARFLPQASPRGCGSAVSQLDTALLPCRPARCFGHFFTVVAGHCGPAFGRQLCQVHAEASRRFRAPRRGLALNLSALRRGGLPHAATARLGQPCQRMQTRRSGAWPALGSQRSLDVPHARLEGVG